MAVKAGVFSKGWHTKGSTSETTPYIWEHQTSINRPPVQGEAAWIMWKANVLNAFLLLLPHERGPGWLHQPWTWRSVKTYQNIININITWRLTHCSQCSAGLPLKGETQGSSVPFPDRKSFPEKTPGCCSAPRRSRSSTTLPSGQDKSLAGKEELDKIVCVTPIRGDSYSH